MPRNRKFHNRACGLHGCGVLVGLVLLTGCGTNRGAAHQDVVAEQRVPGAAGVMSSRDVTQLRRLAVERTQGPAADGYRIGPDDLLQIRIRDLVEASALGLAKSEVIGAAVPDVEPAPAFQEGMRVSADGQITLPQIGVVHVDGMVPSELERNLAKILISRDILRDPQISVVVAEHRSHVVAVVGSVQRPGLYPLTKPGATIADMVWAAGGPTKEAGRLVQFAVGQPGVSPPLGAAPLAFRPVQGPKQVAANTVRPDGTERMTDGGSPLAATAPGESAGGEIGTLGPSAIRIDLDTLLSPADDTARELNVPVRAGDVINVPPAGSVFVDGWVSKPGSYVITRNITLTGALASAGGSLYPADLSEATVRRVVRPGDERIYTVDLEAVAEGRETDFAMLDGDVIYLPARTWKLFPWGVWTLVNSLLRFGASVPIA